MLESREDIRRSILNKIAATDFIALREATGEIPESWPGKGYSAEGWAAYRTQLRALLGALWDMEEDVNPDLLDWPMVPNWPDINRHKSAQERQDHRDRMFEEYGITLTDSVYGIE